MFLQVFVMPVLVIITLKFLATLCMSRVFSYLLFDVSFFFLVLFFLVLCLGRLVSFVFVVCNYIL